MFRVYHLFTCTTDESSIVTTGIIMFVHAGIWNPCNTITTLIGQIKPSTVILSPTKNLAKEMLFKNKEAHPLSAVHSSPICQMLYYKY